MWPACFAASPYQSPFPGRKMSPVTSRAVARSAGSGYLRLMVSAAVQFAMVPIVIRSLGPSQYGLYALILSALGFFALLELGAGAGAMKAAAAGWSTGDWNERNRSLGVQLMISLAAAGVALLLLAGLAPLFGVVFHVANSQRSAVAIAVVLLGLRSAVLSWPFGVLRSALYGHGETVLVNGLQSLGAVLYAGLTWLALHLGFGLVGFATANLVAFLIEHLAYWYFATRRIPRLRFTFDWRDRRRLRDGLSLGGSQLLVAVAGLVLLRTDPIIIQAFLPLSAVGAYAVALKVADQCFLLTRQFVNALSPMIAALHAGQQGDRVRRVASTGTRYALALALLPAVPLALNADLLLTSWVGSSFAPAGPALAILVTAVALMAPQVVASGVLTYTGRHHATGKLAVQAMLVNAITSLLLVRSLGLTGVALGTLIAVLVVDVGLAGRQLCHALDMSVGDYWRRAIRPALAPAIPAVVVGLVLRLMAPADGFVALATHAVMVAATFLLAALAWTLEPAERNIVLNRLRALARLLPTGATS